MKRPLYGELKPATGLQGHPGLWYEKYCDQWLGVGALAWSLSAKEKQTPKTHWIGTVVSGDRAIGHATASLLEGHHARLDALCTRGPAFQQEFLTTSRLVIGIGQEHPVENGFLWHPTLGVPYIPGSSIKGMLRNWLLVWEDSADRMAWFETVQGKGVGELIFLDAFPLDVPKLEADVITPHYDLYYRAPHHNPPADWHNPTPAPFLTVAAKQKFAVRVLQRRRQPGHAVDFVALGQALSEAFETIGIGAKTASGYGRLMPAGVNQHTAAPAPVSAPPVVAVTDPLQEFKAFFARFLPIENHKGDHDVIVATLQQLPEDIRPLAIDHMLGPLKIKKKNCTEALANYLFPTSPSL